MKLRNSFLVSLILVFCLTVPVLAAESEYDLSVNGDGSVMAIYNDETKVLTVSGSGPMRNSTYYGTGIYKDVQTVIIEEGITSIGSQTFRGSSLKSISLPSTLEYIADYAFYCAYYLESITIPANVTEIENHAFYGCDALKSVIFEDGSKLTTIEYNAFSGCDALTQIEIPDGVTSIGSGAFWGCEALTSIIIPESVTNIESSAFGQYGRKATESTVVYNYGGANQVIGENAFSQVSDTPNPATIYHYSTNTAMTAALSESALAPAAVYYLDEPAALTGTLDNGVVWTYDPDTHTLTFSGDGEIPTYADGSQPWYGVASQYGGVGTYVFGSGITGVGSGVFGSYGSSSYGSDGSGSMIYGPSGLDYSGAGGGGASYSGSTPSGGSSGDSGDGSDGGSDSTQPDSDEGKAMIIVDADPTLFKVTVPIAVYVSMDSDGVVSTGEGYYVENQCAMGPILIKNIEVVSETNWALADWESDFSNMKASSKVLGLSINGVEVGSDGSVVMNDSLSSVIRNQEKKDLFFDAKLSAQRAALEENAAAIIFTVDFDKI